MTTLHAYIERPPNKTYWMGFVIVKENGQFSWIKRSFIQRLNSEDATLDAMNIIKEIQEENPGVECITANETINRKKQ